MLLGLILLQAAAGPLPWLLNDEQAGLAARRVEIRKDAERLWADGQKADAVAAEERALSLSRELFGPTHRFALVSLQRLAWWQEQRGQWADAVERCRQAMLVSRRLHGEDAWQAIDAQWRWKTVRTKSGLTAAARADLARLGPLAEESSRLADDGKAARAHALLEEAAAITRRVLGPDHPENAVCLENLSRSLRDQGEYRKAVETMRRAAALLRRTMGVRHPLYASVLGGLADALVEIGEVEEALPAARWAYRVKRAALGADAPGTLDALGALAGVCHDAGDLRTAYRHYRQAIAGYRALGYQDVGLGGALNNLATLLIDGGDHKGALPILEEAVAIRRKQRGDKDATFALVLSSLANCAYHAGDRRRARTLFTESLAVVRAAHGKATPNAAGPLQGLALCLSGEGKHAEAVALLDEGNALIKRSAGVRGIHYANGIAAAGQMLARAGRADDALARYTEASGLFRAGGHRAELARNLYNAGALYARLGRPGAAVPCAEQSLHHAHRLLAGFASVQSERQLFAAALSMSPYLNLRLSLPENRAEESHGHVLAWKGAITARQRRRLALARLEADPEVRGLAAALHDATARVAAGSRGGAGRAELLAEREDLERRLAVARPAFAALTPPTSAALSAALPEGVALIDYFAYKGPEPGMRLDAWVARHGRACVRVALGPLATAEAALNGWRAALEAGRDSPSRAAAVKRLVWSPLDKHLDGAKVVLISPDRALGRLPFAALPGAERGTYLLEDVALAVVPVPQLLPEMLASAAPGAGPLLVTGPVDYDASRPGNPLETPRRWPDLPGTALEADAIAARFGGDAVRLRGRDAGRAEVIEALGKARYAHLATHGFFTSEGQDTTHPGLLSGLVLAGANHPSDTDDGILTALEVAGLDLANLRLAVLSACRTGLGKEAAGEGLLGLQRAFAVAGCRTVVASLWSVDDAATAVLMERFYLHLWGKKMPALEALRRAQLEVLRRPELVEARRKVLARSGLRGLGEAVPVTASVRARSSPPAWWAGFVLSGDWR